MSNNLKNHVIRYAEIVGALGLGPQIFNHIQNGALIAKMILFISVCVILICLRTIGGSTDKLPNSNSKQM